MKDVVRPHEKVLHLMGTPLEKSITEFEHALMCAAEAFYRFYGGILDLDSDAFSFSGEDNVILQQLMNATKPRGVAEVARYANREDISNIQYSLRKLIKAGYVEKTKASTNRDTTYQVTEKGHQFSEKLVAIRRELLIEPSGEIIDFAKQLREGSRLFALITGVYDNGSRIIAGRG